MTISSNFISTLANQGFTKQQTSRQNFQATANNTNSTPADFVTAAAEYKIELGVAQMMFDAARETGNADKATAEGAMR